MIDRKTSASCALAAVLLLTAGAPAFALGTVVANFHNPLGYRCFHGDGWHYDETGHHVYGGYRTCFQIPHAAPKPTGAKTGGSVHVLPCRYYFPNGQCAYGYHKTP